ncbi:MAG: Ig-like domain-containing protein [Candidatus Solibacter sp.]
MATNGSAAGSGAITSPWDVVTGLKGGAGRVHPGDTVWMRGGIYGDSRGVFYNTTVGTATAPIIFRAFPGERATINNWLQVGCCDQSAQPNKGSYTWFWGLEFANNITDRTGGLAGPPDWSAAAVSWLADTWGPGTKFINNVFHDGKQGPALWREATDSEAYGNLVYNNGYKGPDRGHGHGIYAQGREGVKKLHDNFIFNQWGYGIHAYGSGSAYVQNFDLQENVVFNNGLPGGSRGDNLLITGGQGQSGIKVNGNHFYNPVSATDGYNELSWGTGNQDLTVTNNFFVGGRDALDIGGYSSVVFTGNTVYGNIQGVNLKFGLPSSLTLNNNSYFGTGAFGFGGSNTNFTGWKNATHGDVNSLATSGAPAGLQYFVYPNRYEPGRANLVVYNWDSLSLVTIDLSRAGLAAGQTFEIRDAQNFYGAPVFSGTFTGGPVALRMAGLVAAPPNGILGQRGLVVIPPHTGPQFGTFVVLPTSSTPSGGGGGTPPTVSVTAPTANTELIGTVTLSANAAASGGAVVAWVQFQLDGVNIGPAISSPPYSFPWNSSLAANGAHQIKVIAGDTFGQQSTSASIPVTVNNPVLPVSAIFVGLDKTTTGTWKGVYGQDGYVIANNSNSPPSYASVTVSGAATYSWDGSSSQIRALQKGGSASDRIASTFYSNSTFDINVNISDNATHQMALYLLDWDTTSRSETITILRASDQSVLSSQPMSDFNGGVYAIWNIRGAVIVRVAYKVGWNAVVSAVFFGGGATAPGTPNPPSVSLTAPGAGTVSGSISLTATAASTIGLSSVQFQLDGVNLGAAVSGGGPTFTSSWNTTTVGNGAHVLTAIATDTQGQKTTSASVAVTVSNVVTPPPPPPPPPPGQSSASFVGFDASTQGAWKSKYGQDGWIIANDTAKAPPYGTINLLGAAPFTWAYTPDLKTLEPAGTNARSASTFYAVTSLTLDANLTDTGVHQLAIYCLDWDFANRVETMVIRDAATQQVLDTRIVSGFRYGTYVVWNIKGHVTVQVTNSSGPNAVISGVFLGPAAN